MKLSAVVFTHQVTVPGMQGASSEFSSTAVPIEYDRVTDMVRIGNDGYQVDVPRSAVVQWKRDRSKEPPQVKAVCPICNRQFNNLQALGGHKRQAHSTKGKEYDAPRSGTILVKGE